MGFCRILDFIFAIYFLSTIPIAVIIDSQAVLPSEWFPKQLTDLVEWYCKEFKDPLMTSPPIWFQSIIVCELVLHVPFSLVAAIAFIKGSSRSIRLPLVCYSAHLVTALTAILSHVILTDFKNSSQAGPRTTNEKTILAAFYLPYLVLPLLILARTLFSSEYSDTKADLKEAVKKEPSASQKRKKKQY